MQQLKVIAIAVAVASTSVSAGATTIAGWDFSQWGGAGFLSTDGTSPSNTLSANYSSLDPTNNAGAESASYGTLYFDGRFGSTSVTPIGDGSEPFTPAAGSLVSNLTAPVEGLGDNPFDSHTILFDEGQRFTNFLSMGATGPVQVVFAAQLPGLSQMASDWLVSFGARSEVNAQNPTTPLRLEFSTNGLDYVGAALLALGPGDQPYSVPLAGAPPGDRIFVRFGFAGTPELPQFVDNVAIQGVVTPVPEPGAAALLVGSALGLVALRRRCI